MNGHSRVTGHDGDVWLAGVDGCRGGWLAAFWRPRHHEVRIRVVPSFRDILTAPEQPGVIAVDMPIGLPDRAGPGGRAAERAVRPLLGARQSSVFAVPSRSAVEAADYRAACMAALATSDPPRKVSRQLFGLAPRIREIDALLRADAALAARVYEVHPEVVFWRLNAGALAEPKKVKSRPYEPGLVLRRRLLIAAGFQPAIVETAPPPGAGPDDVLDALACATTAQRLRLGLARPFPDPPERDAFGLPMAIWA